MARLLLEVCHKGDDKMKRTILCMVFSILLISSPSLAVDYTITATASNYGTIWPSGAVSVPLSLGKGTPRTFKIWADGAWRQLATW